MENSCEKVNAKSKRKKASWKRTSRGLILRIGNRSNSNYYRVYQKTKKINQGAYDEMSRGVEFISFTGGNAKSTYQRTKALEFLTSLQDIKPLIQRFSNNEFRRSVMFPYLKLTKQNKRWTIIMAIGEEFYFYQYPFFFPNSFLIYKNKYDLEIKLQLIESFSQVELEKKLLVKEFLNQFCVPNKDLTKIKKQLIDSVSRLKDSGLIENEFSLTFKNGSLNETKKIEDLSPGLLCKSESFSFWKKI